MKKKDYILLSICLGFIALWLYAAFSKWGSGEIFLGQLLKQPVPNSWAPILYWLLPSSEICLAILLILPSTRTLSLWGSFLLMLFFSGYILLVVSGYIWKDIPCACMGIFTKLSWLQHLFLNLLLTLIAAIALKVNYVTNNKACLESLKTRSNT